MFMGEYRHNLDEKGRVIVPSKYREQLGELFVLTKGLDGCLFIYPLSEWSVFEQKLKQLPLTNTNARKFVRFFLSGAIECNVDKQGRILIPSNLRVYSEIEKDIVFIGMSSRIEIWSIHKWNHYNEEEFSAEILAEKMEELGI
jgi:MraZ protein